MRKYPRPEDVALVCPLKGGLEPTPQEGSIQILVLQNNTANAKLSGTIYEVFSSLDVVGIT